MDALLNRGFKRLTNEAWYKESNNHKMTVNTSDGCVLVNGKHFGYVMTLRDLDDIIRVWERTDCGDELLNSLIRKQRDDNEKEQLAKDKLSDISRNNEIKDSLMPKEGYTSQSDKIDDVINDINNTIKEDTNDPNQRPTSETTNGPRT